MPTIPTADALRDLPHGVELRPLATHHDPRGSFTELFRDQWRLGPIPVQWNLVWSEPNVLRGVHAHRDHTDFVTVAAGEIVFAVHDARPSSATHRRSALFRVPESGRFLVVIPPGVAHAFYSPARSAHVYAVTTCFDGSDEFGCHWTDPALGLDWPCDAPLLSARDRDAGSYAAMIAALGF